MPKLLVGLLSQRIVGLLVVALLVLAIYFVGYLSGVDWTWLHVAAGAVVAGFAAAVALQQRAAARAASTLEQALRAQGDSQLGGTRPDQRADLEQLKSQFDESLELLRKSKMGRAALHSIPWFVLIGPPGSGKSTLLRQSGLSFPYMTKGRSAIRGLGGTKNCDWWFADRGILLDTAGRYTTEAEDREEWMAFLKLLKRGRKHRPVNGAIVAIGLPELIEASEAEMQAHAESVRDRVDELTRELQTVFPIYVVFTKCDRLRGFVETFDTLNKEQRRQVWGFTFPFQRGADFALAEQFGREFDELYRSLCVRRVDLLASDHFKKRKAQLYAFPLQFLRVKERLQAFLTQLQQDNPYQEVSPIRGVYFTSGTQEGTTIDKILKVLRPADLEQDVPEESRRCYFVDDLFTKVVFEDAGLAAPSVRAARQAKWLRLGTAAALGLAAVATIVWDWGTRSGFAADADRIRAAIAAPGESGPEELRAALDAQLRLLESGSHHLERGGVIDHLEQHYRRSLQAFANGRLGAHVAKAAAAAVAKLPAEGEPAPADGPQKQQRFELAAAAERELADVAAGVEAFRRRRPEQKDSAAAIWRKAVGDGESQTKHFERLFAAADLELTIPEARVALDDARKRLLALLGKEQQSDLREAKELTTAQLFPKAWAGTKDRRTRFGDCNVAVARNWSSKALQLEATGTLLGSASAKSTAPTLEQLFADLDADVQKAQLMTGAASRQPLADLLGGGWVDHVAQQREEFLRVLATDFEAGWSQLLGGLAALAKAREEIPAAADGEGTKRLGIVPELVAAHRIAGEVLGKRGPLAAERSKELAAMVESLQGMQLVNEPPWDKGPGRPRAEATLAQVVDRARAAAKWLADERARVEGLNWSAGPQRDPFFELELSLVEAMVARERAACRAEIQQHADKVVFPDWEKLQNGFPFARDAADEADAAELARALESMLTLAATIGKLEPKDAFAPDPEFVADAASAGDLCDILYAGQVVQPAPNLECTLEIQRQGGAIGSVRLDGENRALGVGRPVDWSMRATESLALTVELVDGQGVSLSIKDLIDERRQRVPENLLNGQRLVPGLWSLLRLFAIGNVRQENDREWLSEIGLIGRPDKVLLIVQCRRPEVARVFNPAWPGDSYTLSRRLWKDR